MKKNIFLFLSLFLISFVCYSDPVHVFKDDFDSIKKKADAGDPRNIKIMIDFYKSGFYYYGKVFKADKSKARYYELLAKGYGVDPYREERLNNAYNDNIDNFHKDFIKEKNKNIPYKDKNLTTKDLFVRDIASLKNKNKLEEGNKNDTSQKHIYWVLDQSNTLGHFLDEKTFIR